MPRNPSRWRSTATDEVPHGKGLTLRQEGWFLKQPCQRGGWHWPGDEISLYLVAAERPKNLCLLARFDAFRRHPDAKLVGHVDQSPENDPVRLPLAHGLNECSVDPEAVDRQPAQIDQRGKTRPEIIQRDLDPGLMQTQ